MIKEKERIQNTKQNSKNGMSISRIITKGTFIILKYFIRHFQRYDLSRETQTTVNKFHSLISQYYNN